MSEPTETSEQSSTGRRTVLRGAAALAGMAAITPLTAGRANAVSSPVQPDEKTDIYTRGAGDVATTRPVGVDKKPKPKKAKGKPPGADLGPATDVPVGAGKIYEDQKIVVTQPKKGEWHAFSAVCTHQQCILADCDGGKINCGCHASSFDFTTGAPDGGPATVPLPKKNVQVVGGRIHAG
jgi:nitrite reductase/ring-hydroxylating ferredoxin subunit